MCNLEISASDTNDVNEAAMENFRIEDSVDCTLSQLQIVKFSYLSGFRAELELIKFLLAHSPVLETIFIHRYIAVKTDKALKIAEEIMQFSRASPKAQIKHLKHPVDMV